MANKKVNEFAAYSTPAADADIIYTKQSTTEKKMTIAQMKGEVGSVDNFYTAGGTANVITLTAAGKTIAPAGYFEGFEVTFEVAADNTAAVTWNVNSLGARNVTYRGAALPAGFLKLGQIVTGRYTTTGPAFEIELSDTVFPNLDKQITASSDEINTLDGLTASTAELNLLDGVTSSTAELNLLDGVTSTTAELNLLDGVTATTTELNYVDVTTPGVAQASKAVVLDAGKNILGLGSISGLGVDLAVVEGGTGASTAAGARTNLGLVIGTDVQAYDADLAAIAALATQAYGRSLLTTSSEANFKQTVNLEIGVDVQAYNANIVALPSGTGMVFYQAAAPTGWTKVVTHNDKALRVVSGTGGGSGGTHGLSSPPSTAHTHTTDTHTHGLPFGFTGGAFCWDTSQVSGTTSYNIFAGGGGGSGTVSAFVSDSGGGGSTSSTGPTAFSPLYIDVIVCTKN